MKIRFKRRFAMADRWIVERTVSNNDPTRPWETSVLDPICGLVATSHSDSYEGSKQIGRLIAAAPELMQTLEALLETNAVKHCNSPFMQGLVSDALEAIAKAEGRQ
jgi:hypothetical protein